MKMHFKGLEFALVGGKIVLTDCFGTAVCKDAEKLPNFNFVELQIAGENHASHCGAKMFESSEWSKLKYISYSETQNKLEIVQASELVSVATHFEAYDDTDVLRVWNTVTNMTDKPITLEHISSFVCCGFGQNGTESVNNLYLHKFYNSWHVECQPVRSSFYNLGLFNGNERCMKRISGCNTGSWSTKEELPQAIIEDADTGRFFMFQIEAAGSWYYEIADNKKLIYLNIGGPNSNFNGWSKVIQPHGGFVTEKVAIVAGDSINKVVGEMTKYRRHIVSACKPDKQLPVIFNEYMHLSWDNPNEERTKKLVPSVAELGAKYYVIDCGWHDDCPYTEIYQKAGKWQPSNLCFPSGIKAAVDFIKSYGMKAGLWLEPEIIGCKCSEMEEYYGDDAFFYRNGKKTVTSNRKFLDFRNEKVREYMSETVARIAGYGVEYLKFDYNQDCGTGNERNADSAGDGLIEQTNAFLGWLFDMKAKYPALIFEGCASGGCRLDYKTLSAYSLVSTSDQTDYKKYPHIAANIFSAVLPEQAAVWSYPVESLGMDVFDVDTFETVNARVSTEQVVMNMVNAMLGRMHLASAVHLLSEEKRALIKEGIELCNSLVAFKREALPYFPCGFNDFNKREAASGLLSGKTLELAVWNMGGDGEIKIPLPDITVKGARIAYPAAASEKVTFEPHSVNISLGKGYRARLLEIKIL